jgi:tetratricopeptide (TPR) repeat protein
MLKPKRKVSKKDLKEDVFVKTTLQAKSYLEENYKQVISVVLGIFALLVIFILYQYVKKQTQEEANNLLGIAQIEINNQNNLKAIERLQTLINEYGSTREATQGLFLLANIYYQQKKFDEAASLYEQFIDSYSGSNILLSSAIAGLAGCYEIKNDFQAAAELYQKAADVADDFMESDNYRFLAGICFKKEGRLDDAKSQFNKIINNTKNEKIKKESEIQLILIESKLSFNQ